MDVIDGNWIKSRLSGDRGQQARLAEALGIDNDKMSKTIRGLRRVQPDEIPRVLKFFNQSSEEPSDPDFEELRSLWPKLTPEVRQFLRNAARGQVEPEDQPPQGYDEAK